MVETDLSAVSLPFFFFCFSTDWTGTAVDKTLDKETENDLTVKSHPQGYTVSFFLQQSQEVEQSHCFDGGVHSPELCIEY